MHSDEDVKTPLTSPFKRTTDVRVVITITVEWGDVASVFGATAEPESDDERHCKDDGDEDDGEFENTVS